MRCPPQWRIPLVIAGALECGMAVAHVELQYEWTGFDFGALPRQLAWALLALNFSWTAMLLALGGLVLYAAMLGPADAFIRAFVFVGGLFWTLHGLYVWVVPIPLPPRLRWLGPVLAAFPAVLIVLHWVPLAPGRRVPASVAGDSPKTLRPGAAAQGGKEAMRGTSTRVRSNRQLGSIAAILFGISGCLMGIYVFSIDPPLRIAGIVGLVCGPIAIIKGWRARRQRSRGL